MNRMNICKIKTKCFHKSYFCRVKFHYKYISPIFSTLRIACFTEEKKGLQDEFGNMTAFNAACNFISDLNECEKKIDGVVSNRGCQHKCNNTVGSFSCSCYNGYDLADDLTTCEGIQVLKYF